MVNEEKIRIMTKLAKYESDPSGAEIRETGYYRTDYIRSHLLTTICSYSVAYILLLFLLGLYYFDYLMSVLRLQEIRFLALGALAVYLLLLLSCTFITVIVYSRKYHQLQKRRREYMSLVKKMKEIYTDHREEGSE